MYLVVIAWLYVTLMMAVAEAASPDGTLLGAFFTFALYGALPLLLVVYLLGAPGRLRALKAAERGEREAGVVEGDDPQRATPAASGAGATAGTASPGAAAMGRSVVFPDADGEAAAGAEPGRVAPMGEKP